MKRPCFPASRLPILVMDGYPDAAASLVLVLELEGFAARSALSGEEALAAAAADPPAVIIVEPRTPGGGWDLIQRLGEPVGGPRPVLVAYTTDTSLSGRESAAGAGVSLYLVKPEFPDVLVGALRRLAREAVKGRPVATGTIDRLLRRALSGIGPVSRKRARPVGCDA